MSKPKTLSRELIRSNNRLWRQLYYDRLYERDAYQVSIMEGFPGAYYSAVHAAGRLTEKLLDATDALFAKHDATPAFFLDERASPRFLEAHGYREVAADGENWWREPVPADFAARKTPRGFDIRPVDPSDKKALMKFLAIDGEANGLEEAILRRLYSHITTRRTYANHFFIGYEDGRACACGCVGIVGRTAFLAEGGVLEKFRRHGHHKAMTLHRLRHVAGKARAAVMISAKPALSNHTARSLGFAKLGARRYFLLGKA